MKNARRRLRLERSVAPAALRLLRRDEPSLDYRQRVADLTRGISALLRAIEELPRATSERESA